MGKLPELEKLRADASRVVSLIVNADNTYGRNIRTVGAEPLVDYILCEVELVCSDAKSIATNSFLDENDRSIARRIGTDVANLYSRIIDRSFEVRTITEFGFKSPNMGSNKSYKEQAFGEE